MWGGLLSPPEAAVVAGPGRVVEAGAVGLAWAELVTAGRRTAGAETPDGRFAPAELAVLPALVGTLDSVVDDFSVLGGRRGLRRRGLVVVDDLESVGVRHVGGGGGLPGKVGDGERDETGSQPERVNCEGAGESGAVSQGSALTARRRPGRASSEARSGGSLALEALSARSAAVWCIPPREGAIN